MEYVVPNNPESYQHMLSKSRQEYLQRSNETDILQYYQIHHLLIEKLEQDFLRLCDMIGIHVIERPMLVFHKKELSMAYVNEINHGIYSKIFSYMDNLIQTDGFEIARVKEEVIKAMDLNFSKKPYHGCTVFGNKIIFIDVGIKSVYDWCTEEEIRKQERREKEKKERYDIIEDKSPENLSLFLVDRKPCYKHFLHFLVHELVHYKFPRMRCERNKKDDIVIRTDTFQKKITKILKDYKRETWAQ